MRTAVAGSEPGGAAVFNAEMLRFADRYGFKPVACRPYRAKTKGRVEWAVSYLRGSFFYGRSFRDLEDLNTQVSSWFVDTAKTRVHGTTGQVPGERLHQEHAHLDPLPLDYQIPMIALGRRVTRDGFISYNGNKYSVPEGLISSEVQLRASLDELHLFQDGELVATHPVQEGRRHRRLDPRHRRKNGSHPFIQEPPLDIFQQVIEVQRRSLEVYERVLS